MLDRRIVVIGLGAVVLGSTTSRAQSTGAGPLDPGRWTIRYSPGMPPRPNAPWHFDFPLQDGIHYVTTPSGPIAGRSVMRMRFRIVGDATFKATQGDAPARVRLYMQRRGDNMGWDHASHRFWSRPLELATGEYKLEEQFLPGRWTNVAGRHDEAGFWAALAEIENIGFTFGGIFAGHGVFAQGNARFHLLEFAVI